LDRLNTIIHEAPPIPEDILVFKGLRQKFDPNFKSLFSTSMNIVTSSGFATSSCCRIYCIAKKGTKALCVLFLSPHSEKEILFPSDVQFTLVDKDNININTKLQKIEKKIDVYELSNYHPS
jgi:hypothetical protein